MKTIKVNFCDLGGGNKTDELILSILKKHYHIELSKTPDFLFYGPFGYNHLSYKNCVKIFKTNENILPNFNWCDYAIGFDYITFGNRYFRFSEGITLSPEVQQRENLPNSLSKRLFCNFIYRNINGGEGARLRPEFCKKLMQYKQVDCPGLVLNNMSAADLESRKGDWANSKIKFLKKYKFTIAFENSMSEGYTTEKLSQPFISKSIPIYWGNPLVIKDFNPKAFINCNDYGNDFDKVIARIIELDQDDEKYMEMLRQPVMQADYDFNVLGNLEKFLVDIIEKGNAPFNKDPLGWEEKSFRRYIKNRTNPGRIIRRFFRRILNK